MQVKRINLLKNYAINYGDIALFQTSLTNHLLTILRDFSNSNEFGTRIHN